MKAVLASLATIFLAPFCSTHQVITYQNIDISSYKPIDAHRLEELLRGSLMHDPECRTGDECDYIFLSRGRLRRSISSTGWARGSYHIDRNSYCTSVRGRRRCFELWENYGNDSLWIRVAVGADPRTGRVVHLIPVRPWML